ncbi:MAG TPA: malectin domain-containing carbohydrate-binding protein [Bryobacteraceae bacterium]|nr:malectin domain-containing carbohydrate-binding protein [Bryobacteraceae bacterium]
MHVGNTPELERAELEAVLQSGIFSRAPNLANFLQYICERHLEGRADQIKEYCIAVEALGRSPDFDQKKDSIVRVEAYKLRKRLSEYYRGAGADHPIEIVIPNGQYAPKFVARNQTEPAESNRTVEVVSPPEAGAPEATPNSKRGSRAAKIGGAVGIVALLAAVIIFALPRKTESPATVPPVKNEVWTGTPAPTPPSEVRFIAGYHGKPYRDRQGRVWGPDAYYNGGQSIAVADPRAVQAQPDPNFIRTKRQGQFHYDIPLRNGTYELHLLFAETDYGSGNPAGGAESDRLFNISINGRIMITNFDAIAEAGAANRLHRRTFKDISPAKDGKLHIAFDPVTAPAFLNALEVLPTLPGKIRPIRLVAREASVTDETGQEWLADEYVTGGRLVVRRDSVVNVREKSIYESERYGNFCYRIPLAQGKYRLTLHFAETWFGTPQNTQPAVGSRLFNVFANGTALLRNFDIAKEAGGANRAIVKTFDNLEPNAQGELVLEFVPVINYACLNALEITETE